MNAANNNFSTFRVAVWTGLIGAIVASGAAFYVSRQKTSFSSTVELELQERPPTAAHAKAHSDPSRPPRRQLPPTDVAPMFAQASPQEPLTPKEHDLREEQELRVRLSRSGQSGGAGTEWQKAATDAADRIMTASRQLKQLSVSPMSCFANGCVLSFSSPDSSQTDELRHRILDGLLSELPGSKYVSTGIKTPDGIASRTVIFYSPGHSPDDPA